MLTTDQYPRSLHDGSVTCFDGERIEAADDIDGANLTAPAVPGHADPRHRG